MAQKARTFISSSEDYGTHVFKGAVADEYLTKQGLPAGLLDDPKWTQTESDKVAAAVMEWANEKGASVFTHWFQPMGASGVRHGMSGQVQNAMFVFGDDGRPKWKLSGKELLKGETDGSSYPSGGMRATHTAGGYTILDPTSPIFMRGDTVFIPTVFVSFYGDALDEKTSSPPLDEERLHRDHPPDEEPRVLCGLCGAEHRLGAGVLPHPAQGALPPP